MPESFTFEESQAPDNSFSFEEANAATFTFEEASATPAPKEGASVAQMADATRATLGVVGRAVAASDLALANKPLEGITVWERGEQKWYPSKEAASEAFNAHMDAAQARADKFTSMPLVTLPGADLGQFGPSQANIPGAVKVAAGAYNAAKAVPEFFTTEIGVGLIASGNLPAIAHRLIAAGFAVDLAAHTPEQIMALAKAVQSGDQQAIGETAAALGLNIVMAGASMKVALHEVAPLTAEAVAKVATIETKAPVHETTVPIGETKSPIVETIEPKPETTTPLTTESVAKVVEKEPVPPRAPTPTEAVSESGKTTPVTAGVEPPANVEVPQTAPLAKPLKIGDPATQSMEITRDLFKSLDSFIEKGDQIGVHTIKRIIEGRPQEEVETVMDERIKGRANPEGERALTNVGSRGPGGAATGEPGTYDPASQLTDALQTINKLDPAKRASDSTRIADLWAAGKSTVEKAWGRVIAAKESLKSNLLTLPEVTPLKKLVGVIDSQLQSSSARSEALGKAFEAAHPSKVRRGAMGILVDSGMDVERVKAALAELPANTPHKIRQAFEAAANLTPKEMDAAQRIKGYFDQRLKDAQDAGVLKNFLEDYYTHVWKSTDKMPTELRGAMNSGQVVSYFENARQRKLESFIDGIKLGLEPVLDPSLVLPRYNYNLDRAIASRAFIKKLTSIKESDGRPTAAPTGSATKIENEAGGTDATLIKPSTKSEETGDYKTVDNPALKGWKWVEKDSEGNPIMVQGDLAIHPAALERIRNMMDKARLTATAPVRVAIAVGAEVKGAKLGILSPFHQIHVGSHALWHLVNPFKLPSEIDWTHPDTKFATESGLKLAGDFHDQIGFSEGIGPGLIAQKLVPYARAYSEYLFKSFIPRLKLKTFEAVYQRDLKRYAGKASQDQIAARAADAVNSAYGELNRKWLGKDGRDPRLQRALQVGLLAPDFLEARGRFVGKAFTKFGGEERMALFVMGATLYTTARVLNQLLDGDSHAKELNMMFSVRHNGRNYSVRSVLGDTAHLFSDWRSFVAHRINPFTTRTAVEAISGRELRTGLKRDTQEQVEDLLRQITPVQMDSMLPGDRAWYEGLTQSLGVTSQHQPTPAEVKKREAKAAKDSKNPPAFEFFYNPAHVKKGATKK